jgi:predicted GNAT family acetyltransferase
MLLDEAPAVEPDPLVRPVRPDEVDRLFPASVAMYTEEVGVSPLGDDGGRGYRSRVAELVRGGRAFARVINDKVVFKAELAVITRHTAQVQGVWVDPQWRGKGLATAGLATVVREALHRYAPTVSLYVNAFNAPARRVYERLGFRRVGTFATVLF